MSSPGLQEHSYLTVLHNFQYKTAEGREIIIKKNEDLYLLHKTNADWWQVVRNLEQRSFYVPATYVQEVSKTSASSIRQNSEEDRANILKPPQDLSYKSMPRESSNAMRNVKKWLAGTIDSKSEPSKTLHSSKVNQQSELTDDGSRGHPTVDLIDHKSRSLERNTRSGHFNNREGVASHQSPRSKNGVEYHEYSGLDLRMEAALQDPFRKELENSLDHRNLGIKIGGKIGTRVRTRSSKSEGSHVNSERVERTETFGKIEKEMLIKLDSRKMNLSVHEESGRDSESFSGTNRFFDFEGNKFSLSRERSTSPNLLYSRQKPIGNCTAVYQEKRATSETTNTATTASSDHKILNDKRQTWAVEELVSELTQMCKERVVNKKPALQLKSTEIRVKFDPLETLTREIHEMNRLRTKVNIPEIEASLKQNSKFSPTNVCNLAINLEESTVTQQKLTDSHKKIDSKVTHQPEETPKIKEARKRYTSVSQTEAEPPKSLNSPKSPKILDEYNEANILNDFNSLERALSNVPRSLSPNKCLCYQKRTCSIHPSVEAPYYSNVKVNMDKVKVRPKLKITTESSVELRLTPSLEKLASEIQFLPARRASQTEENRSDSKPVTNDQGRETDVKTFGEGSKSDDSLECQVHRGILQHRLEYKGSFKTKREEMYIQREKLGTSCMTGGSGLKKSSTLYCTTVPECYRHFCRNYAERVVPILANPIFKRRSRSLGDLEYLEQNFEAKERKEVEIPRIPTCKPVPLPRTKISAVKSREDSSLDKINKEAIATSNSSDGASPRTISEQKKNSREKFDNSQSEVNCRGFDDGLPSFYSFSHKYSNHFDVNTRCNINIKSSTAVGFKTLLCTSDSGSDNCLQSKELLSSSTGNLNDRSSLRAARKSSSSANFNNRTKVTRENLLDKQMLIANASSEALRRHSESEVTAALDVSQQNPVARSEQDAFENAVINLPPGWTHKYDCDTGQICFLNEQGNKWFSSNDAEGKIYFFEENSNESSWALPAVHTDQSLPIRANGENNKVDTNASSTSDRKESARPRTGVVANPSIVSRDFLTKKPRSTGGDWPHLYDGNNMLVLKEGIINRTKITENGKKLRKNWSTSYAVLTELFLLFFKDAKTFTIMKTGQSSMAKPDISVDLNGALAEHGDRASSRKNVYMISTVLGLQVLIQSDNRVVATEWYQEVHRTIWKLPSSCKSQEKLLSIAAVLSIHSGNKRTAESNQSEEPKKFSKIPRSRSIKMKRLDDSLEDLSGSVAERQTKIKAKLRRFFQRRPTVELLVKNGIYKDEPAFGSYLSDVCPTEPPRLPLFVKTCIEVLENKEENMKTDGLYRASGNLSQIQKIRLQVDQYKLDVLTQEEDVHVLAGALKLFFRELKEPLIPSTFFKEAVNASMLKKSSAKVQCFRDIVKGLPPPNYDTLQFLLKHLLRVTSYQEFNRMHIPNLAIVFGPTLMWPAEESANMALDFMQQNLVIECLLSEYNKIFK